MEHLKSSLIEQAQDKFTTIVPYNNMSSLEDGFSVVGNVLLFWFDTVDSSSHLVSTTI